MAKKQKVDDEVKSVPVPVPEGVPGQPAGAEAPGSDAEEDAQRHAEQPTGQDAEEGAGQDAEEGAGQDAEQPTGQDAEEGAGQDAELRPADGDGQAAETGGAPARGEAAAKTATTEVDPALDEAVAAGAGEPLTVAEPLAVAEPLTVAEPEASLDGGQASQDQEISEAAAEQGRSVDADLAAAQAQAQAYLNDLRRLQADFDNYRKRMLREQTARIASATQALVERLLPVLDNFELAISAAEQSRDFDRMLKGVEMVFGELKEVLGNEGLRSIDAQGSQFDPERHEAVVAVDQEDTEAGTVVDVVRTGYELQGKVLRPAMVKVAK